MLIAAIFTWSSWWLKFSGISINTRYSGKQLFSQEIKLLQSKNPYHLFNCHLKSHLYLIYNVDSYVTITIVHDLVPFWGSITIRLYVILITLWPRFINKQNHIMISNQKLVTNMSRFCFMFDESFNFDKSFCVIALIDNRL